MYSYKSKIKTYTLWLHLYKMQKNLNQSVVTESTIVVFVWVGSR